MIVPFLYHLNSSSISFPHMSVPSLECWLPHYCRLSMVSRIVANLVTQRRTRHSLGLWLMRVHCLGNKCLTAIVYSRHTQALIPTHAHSHTIAISSRVCDTNLLQKGRMRHWAPNELVSRKLHYLSLAVADKARRDGPIVPAPCYTNPSFCLDTSCPLPATMRCTFYAQPSQVWAAVRPL